MGYQVGRICHETAEQATNEVMTQVVPTIDKDGVLHHPVFNGQTWTYNEQTVKLQFPVRQYEILPFRRTNRHTDDVCHDCRLCRRRYRETGFMAERKQ